MFFRYRLDCVELCWINPIVMSFSRSEIGRPQAPILNQTADCSLVHLGSGGCLALREEGYIRLTLNRMRIRG